MTPLLLLYLTWLLGGASSPCAAQQSRAEELFSQGRSCQFGQEGAKADEAQALDLYLQALKLDPEFFNAQYSAGFIYYQRGDYANARKYLGQAVNSSRGKSAENEAVASIAYGGCYQKERKFKEAEKWFRAAVRLQPNLVEAHVNLINCYLAQGRVPEARQAIQEAQQAAPNPIYKKIEARIAGNEGWGLDTPMGMKVVGIGLGAGFILLLYLRYRRRSV